MTKKKKKKTNEWTDGRGGKERVESWSYCLSGVVARGSADRGDIARERRRRPLGDGGCQRMRGGESGREEGARGDKRRKGGGEVAGG